MAAAAAAAAGGSGGWRGSLTAGACRTSAGSAACALAAERLTSAGVRRLKVHIVLVLVVGHLQQGQQQRWWGAGPSDSDALPAPQPAAPQRGRGAPCTGIPPMHRGAPGAPWRLVPHPTDQAAAQGGERGGARGPRRGSTPRGARVKKWAWAGTGAAPAPPAHQFCRPTGCCRAPDSPPPPPPRQQSWTPHPILGRLPPWTLAVGKGPQAASS